MKKINLAVVGATGMVGGSFLKVLQERELALKKVYLYASEKSVGKEVEFCGKKYKIIKLSRENIVNKEIDFALFSAGEKISREFAPIFNEIGATVIDNSSAFRMETQVPLVVPEVNLEDVKNSKLISNPNCSTIQCMLPLKALQKAFGLSKIDFVTFQAVSGSGMKGIQDLETTSKGNPGVFYPHQIYNNCLPHIGDFLQNGFTKEEMKMINETKKILHQDNLKISATCVRVPIENSHSISISVKLKKKPTLSKIFEVLNNFENLIVLDNTPTNTYPLATIATNTDEVYVGRIRLDNFDKKIVHMFCVADNIRKGAATNAVQILEKLTEL